MYASSYITFVITLLTLGVVVQRRRYPGDSITFCQANHGRGRRNLPLEGNLGLGLGRIRRGNTPSIMLKEEVQ